MSNFRPISEATTQFLAKARPMLINGAWRLAESGALMPSLNPSDGERIGEVASGGPAEIEDAIQAARAAFDKRVWRAKTPAARAQILWRVADLIDAHADMLAELEALDCGKPFMAARHGDVYIAAEAFRYHAGWCSKIEGKTVEISAPGGPYHSFTRHEPMGVVGLIIPWNGPIAMTAWKLAPALAAGCTAVIKPAELTSLSTLKFGELLVEAGIPAGVVNIVTGKGREVGATLAAHQLVDKISFTGSTATGRHILRAAGGNFKKVTLELGGKSPAIVLADADLAAAAKGIAEGIFSNAGQVCVASSRLYADRKIQDELMTRIIGAAKAIKVGAAMDLSAQMGPLISEDHLNSVSGYIAQGQAEGAELLTGGQRLANSGFYLEPTILATAQNMTVVREEIFGPVLCAMPFDSEDEAVALANDSEFGLAGSVWTRNLSKAHRISEEIQAGIFWVNCHGMPDLAMPFGGYKQSGWGREHGREAVESFMELKSVMMKI